MAERVLIVTNDGKDADYAITNQVKEYMTQAGKICLQCPKDENNSNEGKTVELEAGSGFMQGIFVEYGITMDDDVTTVRNGGFGSTSQR